MSHPPQEKVLEIYRPMGLFLGFYGMCGWMDGWMDGWIDGWMIFYFLRFYSEDFFENLHDE